MTRSSAISFETGISTTICWLLALATQVLTFPVLSLQATVAQSMASNGTVPGVAQLRGWLSTRGLIS